MKKVIILLIFLFPCSVYSDEKPVKSRFIGEWCTKPCYVASPKRPWNLPCNFTITENEIKWSQWDDKNKRFSRKYDLIESNENEEVFRVYGGHKREWYSHTSDPDAVQEIIFKIDHENKYAKGDIKLIDNGGSMFIKRGDNLCP